MTDFDKLNIVLEAGEKRRAERRQFLRAAGSVAAVAGASSLLAACGNDDDNSPTPTPTASATPTPTATATTAIGDGDILNLALNLEYLEAQFYAFAATGSGLPAASLTPGSASSTTVGTVTGGRAVDFGTDTLVAQYAREIAADERAHVDYLRGAIGTTAVAMPNLNISGAANGAFAAAARAAGVANPDGTFDPYASPNNFLLGAFIFEDVGVTAYKGASILISSKTFLEAAAGILAAEAYHAGLVRTVLYNRGLNAQALFDASTAISNARDTLDGGSDLDQGIQGTSNQSNIVPTDGDGIAFSRSAGQVLNIVYLNRQAVTSGGFFPNGLNGRINMSAAS